MADLRSQVGDLVRHHRERSKLTQAELADRIGKSVQLIGRIERGSSAPSFETLDALASALSVAVRDFFGVGGFDAGDKARDPLARLIHRASRLDDADIDWLDRLVQTALSRKSPRRADG